MQTLKKEVRSRILKSAEQEFLSAGFRHASMRRIAEQASISPGNIYAYYDSKMLLFEAVVSPALNAINTLLHCDAERFTTANSLALLTEEIIGVCLQNYAPFLILLTQSQGSPYEHIRESVTQIAAQRFAADFIPESSPQKDDPIYACAFAESLIAGVLYLLLSCKGDRARLAAPLHHLLSSILTKPTVIAQAGQES